MKLSFVKGAVAALAVFSMSATPGVLASSALIEKAQTITSKDDIIGLAVAVVRDGEIEMVRTFGVRNLETQEPVEPSTVFRIASLSKGFTASLVAQLVEEDALTFDDPVTDFAPDLRLKGGGHQRVTIGHLLSHRVGLPPYAYDNILEAGIPPQEIRTRYGDVDLICGVGNCYTYQNVTFDAARLAIEAKEGVSFAEALSARFFQPLGMESASVGMERFIAEADRAVSYSRRRGGFWREREVRPAYYGVPAAGGLNASITDMAAWLSAQLGDAPSVLSDDARAFMQTPQVATPSERRMKSLRAHMNDAWYGYGWRIYDYGGATVINHSGSVEGYSAQIAFIPERRVGVVFMTNSRTSAFFELMPTFLNEELGLPAFETVE